MATPRDAVNAFLNRRRPGDLPGRPSPDFTTPEPAFPLPPGVSPTPAPAAIVPPAAPAEPSNWRAKLGAALQGAAYGAQANVGAVPGQEFRQSLLRGIIGTGAAVSEQQRQEAAAAARDQSFAERMALIEARAETRPTAEDKAREAGLVAEARYPAQSRLRKEAAEQVAARMERLKNLAVSTAGTENEKKGWQWAWDRALEEAKMGYLTDPDEISKMAQRNFAYWKTPKAPSVPVLPD